VREIERGQEIPAHRHAHTAVQAKPHRPCPRHHPSQTPPLRVLKLDPVNLSWNKEWDEEEDQLTMDRGDR
jgi:hypothetical protein